MADQLMNKLQQLMTGYFDNRFTREETILKIAEMLEIARSEGQSIVVAKDIFELMFILKMGL